MKPRQPDRISPRLWFAAVCTVLLATAPMVVSSQTPALIKNINTRVGFGEDGFHGSQLVACGGSLYFDGESADTGKELWKTDGTGAGTQLVVEIAKGTDQGLDPQYLACVGSTLYFANYEMFMTDGSALGTSMVKDIVPGAGASYPKGLTAAGGKVYFHATDGTNGEEPWVSDGTEAGTYMLRNIGPGSTDSMWGSGGFFEFDGWLYFTADNDEYGENRELWRTNLTTDATELFLDLNGSGSGGPYGFTAVGSEFFFSYDDGTNGYELWKSDGTVAGTVMVKDITASGSTYISEFAVMGGLLYFAADDGIAGLELWRSDGTAAGTYLVKDINTSGSSIPQNLEVMGSFLYFSATDGSSGAELWKSDGTSGGTVLVKDINPSGDSSPFYLEALGSTLFFAANDGTAGVELWKSDGTTTGTVMVENINSGPDSSNPWYLTSWGGAVYFSADDGSTGVELWRSDGTALGTEIVKNALTEEGGGFPTIFCESGGILFFRALASGSYELWKSDGTTTGTVIVKDIGPGSASPSNLHDFNGTLLWYGTAWPNGAELWKSDGTSAGTVMVKDIQPGSGSSQVGSFASLPTVAVFRATTSTSGTELWKTDGTTAGTVLVKDIRPGSSGSIPYWMTSVNDVVVFRASLTTSQYELWVTDGTEAGTVQLKDIYPGATGSFPQDFFKAGGLVFFEADDGTHGVELWKTDGTAAGTALVKDINPGSTSSSIGMIADWDGTLFFAVDDGIHGRELWRSDGTTGGTFMVKDVWSGADSSNPSLIGIVNDTMVFSADDGVRGRELWVTDGTEAGTTFLYEILAGPDWWYSYDLASHDGVAYFSAFTPEAGLEIWGTDGTAAGTQFVADVRPGPESSYPFGSYSHVLGDQLVFSATDSLIERELWGMCIGAFYEDLDGDGHGNPNERVFACSEPPGYADPSDDCNDDDDTVYAGAGELCDLKDNDCDLQADEPSFAGLTSAVPLGGSECAVRLDWSSTTACDGAPVYNVYRSGTSGFTPGPGSLLAPCVTGPWFIDTSVVADSTYYYVVRAENPATGGTGPCYGGGEETNVVEFSATPTACVGAAAGMPYFTSRAGDLSVRLEWVNPATGYGMSRVCWKTGGYPTGPDDPEREGCLDDVGSAGSYGTVVHDDTSPLVIVNDTLYYYGLWNNSMSNGSGVWSSGRFTTGRPFDTSAAQKWAYTTGATVLAPAGVRPGVAYYTSSNDRVLHSSQAGPSGGMWPSGWVPASMNGPSQGRPIVIPFGAPTISGADTVAFVGSQDGRVYAFDAETGVELWSSDVLGDAVQASPSGVFSAFSEPYDLILVGTRTPAGDSKFYGLNLVDGTTAWTFDNGGGTAAIGIISSQAWVDAANSRVFFTSRSRTGGSQDTVWCLSFDEDSAGHLWSAAIDNVDSAPNLRDGVLYVGTNTGEVHAFDADDGTPLWTVPYETLDGPVKGTVWVDKQPGGRRLYFSTTTKVHALTDNGGSATELWSAISVAGASPVFVFGDDLYVGSSVSNGSLLRIDKATGNQEGLVQIGDPDAAKAIGSPAYDWVDSAIVVGTGTGASYSVTAGFTGGE